MRQVSEIGLGSRDVQRGFIVKMARASLFFLLYLLYSTPRCRSFFFLRAFIRIATCDPQLQICGIGIKDCRRLKKKTRRRRRACDGLPLV